jgi:glyoxylase-like metal-dependent hydrolase (beta-lactamase superfamily II)
MMKGLMPMLPLRKPIVLVVTLLALLSESAAAQNVEVTYIGNTGFMISSGKTAILIDALFDEGWDLYSVPSRSTRRDMKMARPPFDDVDAILVTHWHDDHFDANLAAEHLSKSIPTRSYSMSPWFARRLTSTAPIPTIRPEQSPSSSKGESLSPIHQQTWSAGNIHPN